MSDKTDKSEKGATASEWEPVFARSGVMADDLAKTKSKSKRSTGTLIGNFFKKHVGKEVAVHLEQGPARAVLKVVDGRANRREYFFMIVSEQEQRPATPDHQKPVDSTAEAGQGAADRNPSATLPDATVPARSATSEQTRDRGNDEPW
jgi:hypothetical protein